MALKERFVMSVVVIGKSPEERIRDELHKRGYKDSQILSIRKSVRNDTELFYDAVVVEEFIGKIRVRIGVSDERGYNNSGRF